MNNIDDLNCKNNLDNQKNEDNNYEKPNLENKIKLLETIKSKIEKLSKEHHIEIYKIIKKSDIIKFNECNGKTHINLSYLEDKYVDEINIYLQQLDMANNIV